MLRLLVLGPHFMITLLTLERGSLCSLSKFFKKILTGKACVFFRTQEKNIALIMDFCGNTIVYSL